MKINLKIQNEGVLNGECHPHSTFNCAYESMKFKSHLFFTDPFSEKNLCIAFGSDFVSHQMVSFWNFAAVSSYDDYKNDWNHVATHQFKSKIICYSLPKFKLNENESSFSCINDFVNIVFSLENGLLVQVNSNNFNKIETGQIDSENSLVCMDQSFSSSILVALNSRKLLKVFRPPFVKASNSNAYFSFFYEYYMMAGYDYWDLLANTRPKVADFIIERIEENLKHSPSQNAFYQRYAALMFSLYFYSNNSCKAF